jgi:hypothetical protein
MRRPFTLYWSSLEKYEECPQKFLWYRGWQGIDCGGGEGEKKPIPERKSEHHLLMGIVIAEAVEHLYNDELWKHPKDLKTRLEEIVNRSFKWQIEKRYINWEESPPQSQLRQVCLDGAINYLKTMKHNKLLGPYARSEVDLLAYVDDYTPIGGRADKIIRRDDTGITIIDGKNSASVGKYTNPDQLKWYALCFYLAYHKLPDHLFFCYYRYPYGSPPDGVDEEAWTGLVEVSFDEADIKELALRAQKTLKAMNQGKFEATPSGKSCRFCEYESVCPERQSTKRTRGPSKTEKAIVEATQESGGGVKLFSLDDL